MDQKNVAGSIDNGIGQFVAEASQAVDNVTPLFDISDYPEDMHDLINECNKRIDEANSKYRIARCREDMFAKGLKAGMYFCTFDRNENMLSFEFNDETRQMLGYDGLSDLPNEFDSWVKTLVPEERDGIVKLFWDSVKMHRELPDITHATYRMKKRMAVSSGSQEQEDLSDARMMVPWRSTWAAIVTSQHSRSWRSI